MHHTAAPTLIAIAAALGFAAAAQAGTAEVQFTNPDAFSDAGVTRWEQKENLDVLARYIQALAAKQLPADQRLKVEVTDVDLAGEVRPSASGLNIRRLRGLADAPRIKLRYTLEAPGQAPRSGEEVLTNLDYLHGLPAMRETPTLYHEKRLLDAWFRTRFAAPA